MRKVEPRSHVRERALCDQRIAFSSVVHALLVGEPRLRTIVGGRRCLDRAAKRVAMLVVEIAELGQGFDVDSELLIVEQCQPPR